MKYMLLMTYGAPPDVDAKHGEMSTWPPEDIKANHEFRHQLGRELDDKGELVDGQGLAGPDRAKVVRYERHGVPFVSDGPFPETKEFLAGFWVVDVESEERAIEIAAKMSAVPGRGGEPLGLPVEVREVMVGPEGG